MVVHFTLHQSPETRACGLPGAAGGALPAAAAGRVCGRHGGVPAHGRRLRVCRLPGVPAAAALPARVSVINTCTMGNDRHADDALLALSCSTCCYANVYSAWFFQYMICR